MPKIFRMTKGGKLVEGIFEGETINTPSMLALEDYLDALGWAEDLGGLEGADRARGQQSRRCSWNGSAEASGRGFLAEDPHTRSNTAVCLKIVDPWFAELRREAQADAAKKLARLLEKEGVAFDVGAYRSAPPGLRIWCGATVETGDLRSAYAVARLGLGTGESCLIADRGAPR